VKKVLVIGCLVAIMGVLSIGVVAQGAGPLMLGDANRDGTINMSDLMLTEQMILGLRPVDVVADANNSGAVNMGDILKIEKIIMGLDQPIPAP
jgi:hypothetical protein